MISARDEVGFGSKNNGVREDRVAVLGCDAVDFVTEGPKATVVIL